MFKLLFAIVLVVLVIAYIKKSKHICKPAAASFRRGSASTSMMDLVVHFGISKGRPEGGTIITEKFDKWKLSAN